MKNYYYFVYVNHTELDYPFIWNLNVWKCNVYWIKIGGKSDKKS